jgi:RNA polymerase sigma factor (TIGR02999 family)
MPSSGRRVTELLHLAAAGQKQAEDELVALVYGELRRIARNLMRREAGHHTLQTTAIVHEAYIRLMGRNVPRFNDRTHFFSVAAKVMRRVLVDYARARRAAKRDGGEAFQIEEAGLTVDLGEPDQFLALDLALTRLTTLDERQARIVEMRFFAGMSVGETADALKISERTVKREWQLAKAWLYGELRA